MRFQGPRTGDKYPLGRPKVARRFQRRSFRHRILRLERGRDVGNVALRGILFPVPYCVVRHAIIFIFAVSSTLWAEEFDPLKVVSAARSQVGVTLTYDASYQRLSYPGGDVPADRGVCSDVIVRALRSQGIDLQEEIHNDMRTHFRVYPKEWGLGKPDRNIDHRRVANIMTYFQRRGYSIVLSKDARDYLPGDVVAWTLDNRLKHMGIVADRKTPSGVPLVIHNIGQGAQEQDILFQYDIIGHYRLTEKKADAGPTAPRPRIKKPRVKPPEPQRPTPPTKPSVSEQPEKRPGE